MGEKLRERVDVEKFLVFAKSILLCDFDRCVAAAVKHQRMVAPEQPRRVDAFGKIGRAVTRFGGVPQAFHLGFSVPVNPTVR
jgi:hypothetical protein